MDERIHLIQHSCVPADIFNVKNLTLLALLYAVLQLHHPFEGQSTAFYCQSDICGCDCVFGGAKSCWLLSILSILTNTDDVSICENYSCRKKQLQKEKIAQICCGLVSPGVSDC